MKHERLILSVILLAGCSSGDDPQDPAADTPSGDVASSDTAVDPASDTPTVDAAEDTVEDAFEEVGEDVTEARANCENAGTDAATAGCLVATMEPDYYVDQANKYFDTLDTSQPEDSIPNYSDLVARWEWPPWLLLTGYERQPMIDSSRLLRQGDPSTVPERDCRFFDEQPFARCYVVFEYEEGLCPIYEEFVFNDAGEMTFIEAWSDIPGMLPFADANDRWAEGADVSRLSTRVPGLGNSDGRIDPAADWMIEAVGDDEVLLDFIYRANDFWATWLELLSDSPEDFFAVGCGW
ncbi:MAG: hypothetical protein ACJAYU_003964 [Bradymonadia bacterium]|jgi:hypothetical protein